MNYAIQSETRHYPYLEITARKRSLKHSLIRVEQGLVLCRLGKHEYAVERGQTLWIPFDCLCGLTFFPDTQITRVDFSLRLNAHFPHNAGFIKLSELAIALLNRLRGCERDHPAFAHLTQLLMLDLTSCEPKLKNSPLSQALATWQPEAHSSVTKEQHVVLLVREALKRSQSGAQTQSIIEQLFSGNAEQYQQLCMLILGRKL
ncbi:AraC family transcriptional regulator [Vibrio mimicus]|uniref:AraC family transcriptional regulator n=1 Tax=Vibrio mimicus TaxID=674 RepID=UPI0011DB00F9|nr:AraC family transcriptional regulator [Vibrio mimicus]TXY26153.1 AraC family transcriptional regulator [Vibrio mimicus]